MGSIASMNKDMVFFFPYIDGLVQNCIISITNALHIKVPVTFHSDGKSLNPNLVASRDFTRSWGKTSVRLVNRGPETLQWRHNGRDSVSNHQPHDCLLSHLFRRRSKKTSKLRVTGLCAGNSPGTGEFPTQRPVTRQMLPFDDVIMRYSIIDQHQTTITQYYEIYGILPRKNVNTS